MEIFETFNFDIVIILILLAFILSGFYYSLYRQTRNTLVLLAPFIILFFTFNKVLEFIYSIDYIVKLRNNLFSYISKVVSIDSYKNITTTFIAYFASFLAISILIKILYNMIKVPVHRRVLNNPTKFSRTVASLLGLINGYIIVILMMFSVKPFIDIDYDKPITSVINETSNEFITISKLNEYQNINVDKFREYDYYVDMFTGRSALDSYNKILEFYNGLTTLNDSLKAIVPTLSDKSQSLITNNLENENYVNTLMKKNDGKLIYKTVLVNEESNPNYNVLKETYDYLINHQGYLFALNNYFIEDLSTYEFIGYYQIFSTNKESIENEFDNFKAKNDFLESLKNFDYYVNNSTVFNNILGAQINEIEEYVETYENMLRDKDLLTTFATKFTQEYPKLTEKENYRSINKVFKDYIKNKEKIDNINPYMSLQSKVILSKNYTDWFEKDLWKNDMLLKSYLIDAINSKTVLGNQLYQEYIFFRYLGFDLSFEILEVGDIETIITRLDELVNKNVLNENEAIKYFNSLFTYNYSPIVKLMNQNKVSSNFKIDVLSLDNKYITEQIKNILN